MTPKVRLSAWYFANYGALACMPYMSTLLSDRGVDDRTLPALLVLTPLGTLLGGPAWTWLADRTQRGHAVLVGAGIAAWAACLWMSLGTSPALLATGLFAFAVARSPQVPLADALTVQTVGRERYGGVRAWGSVAYVAIALVNGRLEGNGPLWIAVGLLGAAVLVSTTLPAPPVVPRRPAGEVLRALARQPALIPLTVVGILHGTTITAYDALWPLHVRRLGLDGAVAGNGIAVGVGVEVAVLALGPVLLRRFSPSTLLVVATVAGIPRFWLTGTVTEPWALVALQSLHALTFAAYWVAGVAIYARLAPVGLEGATQSLLLASTFGVGAFASQGLAGVVLANGTTSDLFRCLAGVAALATLAALWARHNARRADPR